VSTPRQLDEDQHGRGPPSDRVSNTCVLCGRRDVETHLVGLLRCVQCGHVWADMRLSGKELSRLYSQTYFQGGEYLDYARESPALRRNFRPRVRELAKRYPKGARLYEVGVAYGYFLKEAGAHFRAAGCDISADAIRHAREVLGVQAECTDFLSRAADEPFDLICMWDTVEHLQEPSRYIKKAAAELRSGGLLALTTGDIGSAHAIRRGAKWRLIHPPTHLHYFTAHSMRTLLEAVGFVDIQIRHLPFWRTSDSVAYHVLSAGKPGIGALVYAILNRTYLLRWSFPLNLHDLMTVYAVKP